VTSKVRAIRWWAATHFTYQSIARPRFSQASLPLKSIVRNLTLANLGCIPKVRHCLLRQGADLKTQAPDFVAGSSRFLTAEHSGRGVLNDSAQGEIVEFSVSMGCSKNNSRKDRAGTLQIFNTFRISIVIESCYSTGL
jgi:hypothetical protein